MSMIAGLFFIIFAAIQVLIYLSIRRGWFSISVTAGIGVVFSILMGVLMSLAQGNILLQALVVGVLMGGIFSGVTLSAAWYFQSNDARAQYYANQGE